jgi:hypothetical protein
MRETLKLSAVLMILTGCGPVPPPAPDVVPQELVPAGFSQADCHFTGEQTSGASEGMGGGSNYMSKVTTQGSSRPVSCHRKDTLGPDQPPTSGEPHEHCGRHGVLMLCGTAS